MRLASLMLAAWTAFAAQIVEGRVVNSVTGTGVPSVVVRLIPVSERPDTLPTATTDAQGHFRIEDVKEGAYLARYNCPGFWPIPNALHSGSQPQIQVRAGSEPTRVEVQLQPVPRISGRVLDAAGKPVPNATLWLLWESKGCSPPSCFPFSHQSKTGANGEYIMGDPDIPGTWLLSASPPSTWKPPESRDGQAFGWAQTYYPGVSDSQLADRIIVQAGVDLSHLDIKLAAAPVHRVRGKLLDARGEPVPKAPVELTKTLGPSIEQETGEDGGFEFPAVADDEWRLSATVDRENGKLRAYQSVRVEGKDLENLPLRLTAAFSLHGKVVMEVAAGAAAADPPPVMMAFNSGGAPATDPSRMLGGDPDENGEVTIENVYPGTYQILPGPAPPGYYLDSVRFGGRDALGPDVPVLNDALPFTVTYKSGGGSVRGTVEGCEKGTVLLIPQDAALRRGLFVRTTTCGQNGRFEFPTVRPGEYLGLAIASDGLLLWYAVLWDDTLMNQAAKVTVRANESTSAQLRLVTRQ